MTVVQNMTLQDSHACCMIAMHAMCCTINYGCEDKYSTIDIIIPATLSQLPDSCGVAVTGSDDTPWIIRKHELNWSSALTVKLYDNKN